MSENQLKEQELNTVVGGAGIDKPTQAKYDLKYSYGSGLLSSGIPNHEIIITVVGYDRVEGNTVYYILEYLERSYYGIKERVNIVKPESYIDQHQHNK